MSKEKSGGVELALLGLFKWVVVTTMLVLMVGALGLLVSGGVHMTGEPVPAEPAKQAPAPKFDAAEFIKSLSPKESDEVDANAAGGQPKLEEDEDEKLFEAQLEKLWVHFERFQMACKGAVTFEKDAFKEAFRQTALKRLVVSRGKDFAVSQDGFVGAVLSNDEALNRCRSGKGNVLLNAIDFHRESWDRQEAAAKAFADAEESRVNAFKAREVARIEERRAFAMQSFIAAAVSFGLFMLVALVLIFARIESNLRGVTLVKAGEEG